MERRAARPGPVVSPSAGRVAEGPRTSQESVSAQRAEVRSLVAGTGPAPDAPIQLVKASAVAQSRELLQLLGQTPQAAASPTSGLPSPLQASIGALTGMDLSDVKVHHNSGKPAQLHAHAYAQGSEIHVAPGQEKYLAHEAWHVVQQRQGRVAPTTDTRGTAVNDDRRLEREADVMGAKAAAGGTSAQRAEGVQLGAGAAEGDVAQLALATVDPNTGPLNLDARDKLGTGVVFMYNPAQPEGKDVEDSVGWSDILAPSGWAGLGVAPTGYHRAHAYSNAFGGAGDKKNVAWWPHAKELDWTITEEQVRGGGLGQDAGWKPGTGEKGTYAVTRTMAASPNLAASYAAGLKKAVAWGFNDARDAWTRALGLCKDGGERTAAGTSKTETSAKVDNSLANGFKALNFDNINSGIIDTMTMAYTITTPGAGAGGSRANVAKTLSAGALDATKFGLQDKPAEIWTQMVSANAGAFSVKFLKGLTGRLPAPKGTKPVLLTPHLDGFGAPK